MRFSGPVILVLAVFFVAFHSFDERFRRLEMWRDGIEVMLGYRVEDILFEVTAYCDTGSAASGYRIDHMDDKKVVAVDPSEWSFNQVFVLPEMGMVIAHDTGHFVKGRRRLDLFVADCAEALRWGRRDVRGAALISKE